MTTNQPLHLTAEQAVGDWVTADYRVAAVFDKYGIDFAAADKDRLPRRAPSKESAQRRSYKRWLTSLKQRAAASAMTNGL
ncbi:MAG: hypothetical protein M5U34_06385 [Chloroflexi bacterium]|nr:hypothetical protein [Chloroflexota bacterium]